MKKLVSLILVFAVISCILAGAGCSTSPSKSDPVAAKEVIVEGNPDVKYVSYRVYKILSCESDASLVGQYLISSGNWDKYLERVRIGTNTCVCETTEYDMPITVCEDDVNYYITAWKYIGDKVVCSEAEVIEEFATKQEIESELDWTDVTYYDD